jgi:hypothetical protein
MRKTILVLLIICLLGLTGCGYMGEGKQSGYITAVEKSGLVFPTYSAYIKTDLSSSQEDKYCVDNDDLAPLLEKVQEGKIRVTIKYHEEFMIGPWRCGPQDIAIIDSFTIINSSEVKP